MDKTTFLETLKANRTQWEAALSEVAEARLALPGVEGNWSIKDIVAHLTWYEREMVGLIQSRALVGSPHWNLPTTEARNSAIYEENRDRPLPDVLAEAQQVHAQLVVALQTLTDEELNDAQHFADMPPDWVPWQVIAGNSYEHYQQHTPLIQAWISKTERR